MRTSRAVMMSFCLAAGGSVLASGQPDPSFGDGGLVVVQADDEQPFGANTSVTC